MEGWHDPMRKTRTLEREISRLRAGIEELAERYADSNVWGGVSDRLKALLLTTGEPKR